MNPSYYPRDYHKCEVVSAGGKSIPSGLQVNIKNLEDNKIHLLSKSEADGIKDQSQSNRVDTRLIFIAVLPKCKNPNEKTKSDDMQVEHFNPDSLVFVTKVTQDGH